mmetsp:Transcript_24582/g.46629  ORF Transcript_24582/g.46629 Transcript_24582/m.46629 type:complete len:204 (+) Transcript_24582:454-1065(+)
MRSSRSNCTALFKFAISPSTTAWNLSSCALRPLTVSRTSACICASEFSRITLSWSTFSCVRKMSSPTRLRVCASRSSRATRSSSSAPCVSSTLTTSVCSTCSMSARRCSFSSLRPEASSAKLRERASMEALTPICISRICDWCFSCRLLSSLSSVACSALSASIRRLISASMLRSSLCTWSTRLWRRCSSASRRCCFSLSRSL